MDNIQKSFEDLNNLFKSDNQLVSESFEKSLKNSTDSESFWKSWSTDLKEKFPSGDWKTVNGAKVFVNDGKVIAGLEGFNGEIDKFFKEKEAKKGDGFKSGDILTDKEGNKFIILDILKENKVKVENYPNRDKGFNRSSSPLEDRSLTKDLSDLEIYISSKRIEFENLVEQLTSKIAMTDDKPLKRLDELVSKDPSVIPHPPKELKELYSEGKAVLLTFRTLSGDREEKYKQLEKINPKWEEKWSSFTDLNNNVKTKKFKYGIIVDNKSIFNVTNIDKNTIQIKDRYSDKEIIASKIKNGNIELKMNGKRFDSTMSLTDSTEMDDRFIQGLAREVYLS